MREFERRQPVNPDDIIYFGNLCNPNQITDDVFEVASGCTNDALEVMIKGINVHSEYKYVGDTDNQARILDKYGIDGSNPDIMTVFENTATNPYILVIRKTKAQMIIEAHRPFNLKTVINPQMEEVQKPINPVITMIKAKVTEVLDDWMPDFGKFDKHTRIDVYDIFNQATSLAFPDWRDKLHNDKWKREYLQKLTPSVIDAFSSRLPAPVAEILQSTYLGDIDGGQITTWSATYIVAKDNKYNLPTITKHSK